MVFHDFLWGLRIFWGFYGLPVGFTDFLCLCRSAAYCRLLQPAAACRCSRLQPAAAACCSLLQPAAACCSLLLQPAAACCSLLQPAAGLLQPAAACCCSLLRPDAALLFTDFLCVLRIFCGFYGFSVIFMNFFVYKE